MTTQHLDLGCGNVPRNPYGRDELFGLDIAAQPANPRIAVANLVLDRIPFETSRFDSVSAYDFLEHVPRVFPTRDYQATRFPFIELMNEIWRTLKPGGMFYASTPVYPHASAFVDPTHVNILTSATSMYFTRPHRMAAMYGFVGDFRCVRSQLGKPTAQTLYLPEPVGFFQRGRRKIRQMRGLCTHVIWEFEALK
jgi:SAM-dependent methyltransferase